MSTSINLRTLALKSLMKFGRWPELTVQEMINIGRQRELLRSYYGLSMINFNQEIKDLIGITPDLEIQKPGKLDKIACAEMTYKVYGLFIEKRESVDYNAKNINKFDKQDRTRRSSAKAGLKNSKRILKDKNQGK